MGSDTRVPTMGSDTKVLTMGSDTKVLTMGSDTRVRDIMILTLQMQAGPAHPVRGSGIHHGCRARSPTARDRRSAATPSYAPHCRSPCRA